MKQLYALLLLQLMWGGVNAGTPFLCSIDPNPCDSTPSKCVWDLRGNIFDIIFQKTSPQNLIVYGNGTNTDYHDAYFHEDAVDFGCTILTDGCSDFSNNYPDTLKIFVFYPKHDYSNATGCRLPVFIFVHGGGFSDCIGMNPSGNLTDACKTMAHKGFVTFSVEYRRGRKRDPLPGGYTSVFENAAIYRAAQDVRGAIRYIIYRQIHHNLYINEDPYQIDVNNIFLGGNSAGALSVITAAYFYEPASQSKLNDIFPVVNSTISNVMGAADIDFYLGNDAYNYMQGVRGILSMWGSLFIPASARNNPAAYFNSSPYKPPIIAFHGKQDDVFPYIAQPVNFSPTNNLSGHIPFNSTGSCVVSGTYALEGDASTIDLYNAGSKGIFDYVLQPLGIFSEVYIDNQMAHGLDDDDPACGNCSSNPFQKYNTAHTACILCGFQSNFGTPYNNKTDVYNYIMQRAAIFFQAIMTGTQSQVTQTVFIEEQNNRITVCP